MSQINRIGIASVLVLSGLLLLGGCGSSTPNSKTPYDAAKGKHLENWVHEGHAIAAADDQNACVECHGADYLGGISGVSCFQCHLNGTPAAGACTSCHGNPPAGSFAPNRNGAHSAHYTFAAGMNGCNSCHNGAGSGTQNHANGIVDVAFLSVYSAKSGTATRNSDGTCSKVSCHGGQATPAWLSGATIDVNTACLSCHAFGTAEYNGFSSGQHDFHVNTRQWNGECWRCHDVTKLADVHFANLNTTALDGQASLTLQSYLNYDKNAKTCNALCHPGTRGW